MILAKKMPGRSIATLCKKWVEAGFLEIVDPSNKARKYKLAHHYDTLIGIDEGNKK